MLGSLVGLAIVAGTLVPTDVWAPPVGGIVNASFTSGWPLATVAVQGVNEASTVAPGVALATADGLVTLTAESITVAAGVVTFDYSLMLDDVTAAPTGHVEVFLACVSSSSSVRNSSSLSWSWTPAMDSYWTVSEGVSRRVSGTVDFTPTANCLYGSKRQIVALADLGLGAAVGNGYGTDAIGWLATPSATYPFNAEPGYAPNTVRVYQCASGTACKYRLLTVGPTRPPDFPGTGMYYLGTAYYWNYGENWNGPSLALHWSALMGSGTCTTKAIYVNAVSADGLYHPNGQNYSAPPCTLPGAWTYVTGVGVSVAASPSGMGYWWVGTAALYSTTPTLRYHPPGSPLRASAYQGHRSVATLVSFDALDGLMYVPGGVADNMASVPGLCTEDFGDCFTRCGLLVIDPGWLPCVLRPTVAFASFNSALIADLRDSEGIGRALELAAMIGTPLGVFANAAGGSCGTFATIPLGEYGGDVALSSCGLPAEAVTTIRLGLSVMLMFGALMFGAYLVLSPLGLWPKRLGDDSK